MHFYERREFMGRMLGGLAMTVALPSPAQSTYPNKPIRMILPFAAAGPTDVVGRIIAAKLGEELGQTVVVENRAAASGVVAGEFVARAAPDGYNLLFMSSTMVTAAALGSKLPYDVIKDFAPVAWTTTVPLVLLVKPDSPLRTVQDLMKMLAANPGKYTYGSGGNGTIIHVVCLQLLQASGSSAVHVAYKGTGPALIDLMSGQIDFAIDAMSSAMGFIRSGQLRPLVVTSSERMALLPNVPTVAETWVPGFTASTFNGVLVPLGTPAPVIAKLNAALNKVVRNPEVRQQLESRGALVEEGPPEKMAAFLKTELDRWTGVLRTAGIKAE